jgi:adenine-specific DNA-methyltransferase
VNQERQPHNPFSRARPERHERGQYATPASIATRMANSLRFDVAAVRLLDAGAGHGALLVACIEAASRSEAVERIEVIAIEADAEVIPSLKEAIQQAADIARALGKEVVQEAVSQDFVVWGLGALSNDEERFTHAIQNPPYVKLAANSEHMRLLKAEGIEVPNLYAAFLALTARLLAPNGELVAITPRSFCNGPHFSAFRRDFLDRMRLLSAHLFDRRDRVFREDEVLQESIIFHAQTREGGSAPAHVQISASRDQSSAEERSAEVPYELVVRPGDAASTLFLPTCDEDLQVLAEVGRVETRLSHLELKVSTGPVVDFRVEDSYRVSGQEQGAVPLIYPAHFRDGRVQWPLETDTKRDGLVPHEEVKRQLFPPGVYVVLKRISSKEQGRRLEAAIYDSEEVAPGSPVGFENHVNVIHRGKEGLTKALALGLAAYLNSKQVDQYFRIFNGHTQVNATDLRGLPFPPKEELERLGRVVLEAAGSIPARQGWAG